MDVQLAARVSFIALVSRPPLLVSVLIQIPVKRRGPAGALYVCTD